MKRTLTLEIPDDLYEPLVQLAKQKGQSPEALAAELLIAAGKAALDDPIEKYIGAIKSNTSGWGAQHDEYIGLSLAEQLLNKMKD